MALSRFIDIYNPRQSGFMRGGATAFLASSQ
jgi:hypothetical protein